MNGRPRRTRHAGRDQRLSYSRVLELARKLGPLKRRTKSRRIVWTPAYDELLGLATDKDLAREWKADNTALWWRRRLINRLPFRDSGHGTVVWTAEMVRDLGAMTDGEVAKRHWISVRSVTLERTRRKIPPCYTRRNSPRLGPMFESLLGKIPDAVLAGKLGCAKKTIAEARCRNGIFVERKCKVDWSDIAIRKKMGTMSDRALAKELGVAYPTARKWRIRLKIPAYQRSPGRRRRG